MTKPVTENYTPHLDLLIVLKNLKNREIPIGFLSQKFGRTDQETASMLAGMQEKGVSLTFKTEGKETKITYSP